MEWVAGILALVVVVLIALYRRALREARHAKNYALLILLDEGVYSAQRKGLTELVRSLDAKNAGDLGIKVNLALDELTERLAYTLLGTAGLLWKLRNS